MLKERLFTESELRRKLSELNDPLEAFKQYIDFKPWQEAVDKALPRCDGAQGGRPPYPTPLMVKVMFLKGLYNCSDDKLEFRIADRRSFRRFLELEHTSRIPDAETIAHFSHRLAQAGLGEAFFTQALRQVERAGFIARGGQLIDATIIPAPISRISAGERAQLEKGETPQGWGVAKQRQHDRDARWTKKNSRAYFGYKLHANVDHRYKILRKIKVTPANVHDSTCFEDVLDSFNTSREVLADKGYAKQEREQALKAAGAIPRIQRKALKNKPLSECQARRNRGIAKKRSRVEHIFAGLEGMGGKFVRAIGLSRVNLAIQLKAAVYNLSRLVFLMKTEGKAGYCA